MNLIFGTYKYKSHVRVSAICVFVAAAGTNFKNTCAGGVLGVCPSLHKPRLMGIFLFGPDFLFSETDRRRVSRPVRQGKARFAPFVGGFPTSGPSYRDHRVFFFFFFWFSRKLKDSALNSN